MRKMASLSNTCYHYCVSTPIENDIISNLLKALNRIIAEKHTMKQQTSQIGKILKKGQMFYKQTPTSSHHRSRVTNNALDFY